MKVLLICPSNEIEKSISNILEQASEINYSFIELIEKISMTNQILYNKIHTTFGIKYIDKNGVQYDKLVGDVSKNEKWILKLEKIQKWIIKMWVKNNSQKQLNFYLGSNSQIYDFEKIEKHILNWKKCFNGLVIIFDSIEKYGKFKKEPYSKLFKTLLLDEKKHLKEQVLIFINKITF